MYGLNVLGTCQCADNDTLVLGCALVKYREDDAFQNIKLRRCWINPPVTSEATKVAMSLLSVAATCF